MIHTRFLLAKENKEIYQLLGALNKLGEDSSIDLPLQDFIKIYVSQLNHCLYCINLHIKDALKNGETLERIVSLNAWQESNFYTTKEKAVLQFIKEMTFISEQGICEATYGKINSYFKEKEIGELLLLITTMNTFNRLGITCLLQP